jgi:hypothetical protein
MPGMTFDPARLCRKRPPLRSERMPFIPRLKSLGFSGIAYKKYWLYFYEHLLLFVLPLTVAVMKTPPNKTLST